VRAIGGVGLATTEMVASKALIRGSVRTEEYLRVPAGDRPLAAQIGAASPEEARDAAEILAARGFDAVDLNLGCPMRKIARKGGGAGLARDLDAAADVARAAVAAVRIPVTAKMRLGHGPEDLTAPDLARALAGAGVAAVAVHGRTRAQGFAGTVNLAGIRSVVHARPGIPVIGNGDVRSAEDARRMIRETGVDGVLIGRAAIVNPWIFREALALLETGRTPAPPSIEERLAACERHFRFLAEDDGEARAALRFRKVLRAYGRALAGGAAFWDAAARIGSLADVLALLDTLRHGAGGAPVADPAAGALIAVPDGPTDHW
jgi:nifR3 family TIM-barrel protein